MLLSSDLNVIFFVLQVSNEKFCNLGLNPVTLEGNLMDEVTDITQKYQAR